MMLLVVVSRLGLNPPPPPIPTLLPNYLTLWQAILQSINATVRVPTFQIVAKVCYNFPFSCEYTLQPLPVLHDSCTIVPSTSVQ